jgi:uncharacterized MAPEG superfamily protein
MRQVTKQGIRVDNAWYFSGLLEPGSRVFCRMDPDDMGRLYAFAEDQVTFIAEAICPERAGVDPRAAVAEAQAQRTRIMREGTAELRAAARAVKPRDMIDAVLGLAERKADASNIHAFPRASEIHMTDHLSGAEAAIAVAQAPPAGAPEPEGAPPAPAAPTNIVALPETPKHRFRRALAIREAMDAGAEVTVQEAKWLGGYELTPEFQAHEMMLSVNGREWLEA